MTVAVVERKLVGGTCVNYGCIPTKTLVASAHAAHLACRGADFGVLAGEVSVDMAKVKARKDKNRGRRSPWRRRLDHRDDRLHFLRGHARFVGPKTLQIDDRTIEADRIFLNVGGRAVIPDIPAWPMSTT